MMEICEFNLPVDELHARAMRDLRPINPESQPAPTITLDVDFYPQVKALLLRRGWFVAMTGKAQTNEEWRENRSTFNYRKLLTWYEWCVMQHGDKWFVLENEPPEDWNENHDEDL